jgi:hypothetical protein
MPDSRGPCNRSFCCTTACGSPAARRAATIHRPAADAKPRCQSEALLPPDEQAAHHQTRAVRCSRLLGRPGKECAPAILDRSATPTANLFVPTRSGDARREPPTPAVRTCVMRALEKPAPRTTNRATPALAKRALTRLRRRRAARLEGDVLLQRTMRGCLRTKSGGNQWCEGRGKRRTADLQTAPAACDAHAIGTADFKPPACAMQHDPRRDGRMKRGLREPSNRVRNGASDPRTNLLGRCPTACASAAARRAATLHRPAARCEATANRQWLGQPPASGASGLQAAGGQLHALVRQRHAGTRIRAPEACDGRSSYPLHSAPAAPTRTRPTAAGRMLASENDLDCQAGGTRTQSRATPALADRAATQRRMTAEAPGLKATTLSTANDARETRTQSGPEADERRTTGDANQKNHFRLRRRGLKARAARQLLKTPNVCTARAARPARQPASAAYAVDALPKERPRDARAAGHAEDHAARMKQTSKARIARTQQPGRNGSSDTKSILAPLSNGLRLSCRPPCTDHTPTAARCEAAMPARSADGRRLRGTRPTKRGRSAAADC